MLKSKPKLAVSACLLGYTCKYNGGSNENTAVKALAENYQLIAVCPETAGGLSAPREPAEICGGSAAAVWQGRAQVRNRAGDDVTEAFLRGAATVLAQLQRLDIKCALLKEGSPSCGSNLVYNGEFCGQKISGCGVTTELLRQNAVVVYSENDFKGERN